jgi:hypothetical protein
MAVPFTPTRYHDELYEQVSPLAYDDANQGYALFSYTGAMAEPYDQIVGYASDLADGTPGWAVLMSADTCPVEALPWLAQFVGVTGLAGLTEQQQRDRIKATDGFKRGTIQAMIANAQRLLTGTKTVYYRERDVSVSAVAGGAYGISFLTFASETADVAAVLAALTQQKPAGLIMSYNTVTGGSYLIVRTNYASYTVIRSTFATYSGLRNLAPGT